MSILKGGCLCGGVRYETPPGALTLVCHCRNCQKQSGTAFSVNIIVPSEGVKVEGDIATFQDSGDTGTVVDRQFCPRCGSALITRVATHPEFIIVKAGTLDTPQKADAPAAEIFCNRAFDWVKAVADKRFPLGATSTQLFS